jgi:hypothetical protein
VEYVPAAEQPQQIGRYRVQKILGKGGFGLVYLAYDDQLKRAVAIKVPHRDRVERPEDAQAYLTEARTVANLDHPNIVPVYDVGGTEHFPCYIVSKYIDGTDLFTRLKQHPGTCGSRQPRDRLPWLAAPASLRVFIDGALRSWHDAVLLRRRRRRKSATTPVRRRRGTHPRRPQVI